MGQHPGADKASVGISLRPHARVLAARQKLAPGAPLAPRRSWATRSSKPLTSSDLELLNNVNNCQCLSISGGGGCDSTRHVSLRPHARVLAARQKLPAPGLPRGGPRTPSILYYTPPLLKIIILSREGPRPHIEVSLELPLKIYKYY